MLLLPLARLAGPVLQQVAPSSAMGSMLHGICHCLVNFEDGDLRSILAKLLFVFSS
jgi:hypothetical protein